MKKILTILVCFILFSVVALPAQAGIFDEIKDNLGLFNQTAGLPAEHNLSTIIVNLINVILSFLALIFIVMVLYGGFSYMTAGGTPEKAKKAKDIIKDSIIGVIIILFAYIIVNFVIIEIIRAIIKTG